MITRHTSSADDWIEDEPYEFDDDQFDDNLVTDLSGDDHDVDRWGHDRHAAREPNEGARAYRAPEPEPDEHLDRTPAWPDYDDLPPWRDTTSPAAWAEELPAPAPVPPPVPASERAGGAWDVSGMPVRPAPAPRSRQRLTAELPDLDDALFDEDRVIRAERPTGVRDESSESPHQPGAASSRDSYFRASRYPRSEQAASFRDGPAPEALDPESTLPDIESDRIDVRDVVARGAELIDRRIEVAPDVPRQCRTCRSFRSADGGTRGWCTNEWAFTHRRMVNEDDLACVSAIGCWWMPADHLRLDLDEESGNIHTPRMDELIARNRPAARKVSGE